jgi:tetratricopeptide (TPR) repeat protein/tRNA A-37 threonylcarbamoyl transferase component Bud32
VPAEDDPRLIRIAEAIADGSPLDWSEGGDLVSPEDADQVRELRAIAQLAAVHRQLIDADSCRSLGDVLSAAPAEFDRSKGVPWGPLLVLDEVGGGSFGKVYRAWDPSLDHEVALKRMRLPAHTPASQAASLVREGQLLARVRHQNVITVHGACEIDGEVGIWMEFVHGKTLEQIVRSDGPMSAQEASVVGESLCKALAAVHQAGLLHRDIKASNVMREAGGRIVMLDFGSGTEADLEQSGGTGRLAGTPLYMAPELLQGATASVQSDIYSLGVLLFYLTTGRYPVDGKSLIDIRAAHQAGRKRLLSDVRSDLPSHFVDAIERALSPLPEHRCPSAGSLLRSLTRSGSHDAPAQRNTRHWLAAGLVLTVCVLAAVGIFLRGVRDRPPKAARAPVIAVLPSSEVSGIDDESFITGLSAVMTAELSTFPGIVVAPLLQTTEAASKRQPAAIARELGLDYMIRGTTERQGSNRVVTLTITDTATNSTRATRRFEETSVSVFPLQVKIAEWLVDQVARIVGKPVTVPYPPQVTGNMQALEEYAQARRFLDRRDLSGNIDHAIAALNRAIERDPKFALAHAALGEAYWDQYEATFDSSAAEAAREATLEALRLDPNQPLVRYALALIYQGTGRRKEAIDELQKAIEQQPFSDELHRLLGRVYAADGRIDQAFGEFLTAIRIRPGFWANYRALGLAYYDAHRYQDAISALTRLTELQPDSAPGFQMLGTSYHAIGDLPHALENYQRANALKPSPTAWSNIGTIHYHQQHFLEAASAYRESIRLRPTEPATFRNLGDALTRLGDRDGARSAYRTAIRECEARLKIERNDSRILALEALTFAKVGDHAKAQTLIEAALAISASGDVLYQKAVIQTLKHSLEPALATLRLAIENGYSPVLAAEDDDLAALHDKPAFLTIVAKKG